jgi:hypothetical protein
LNEKKRNTGLPFKNMNIRTSVNIATSLMFLVLAAYIAFFIPDKQSSELRLFALLMGSYGIWRIFRPVRASHGDNEN